MKALFLAGRAIFGGFFLYNGINHITQREALAQYADAKKVPLPDVGVLGSGVLLTAAGLSLILGWKPKLGVLGIATFLGVVSAMMHDFWNADPQNAQNEMIHFSKNMALLGAALALAGVEEPWPVSVGS
ncbi:MAG: DoxX family protein [Acidobacteriaceae bacterium]|nr:DoxX family protein [Acidobacteriaceae bacterium]